MHAMELITFLIDFILHVDRHLETFVTNNGTWVYALLFLIIFVETGLVVMPFLPGDSLLFVVGAMCGVGLMDYTVVVPLLMIAAVAGNQPDSARAAAGTLARLVAQGSFALPTFGTNDGQFPGSAGKGCILGPPPQDAEERHAEVEDRHETEVAEQAEHERHRHDRREPLEAADHQRCQRDEQRRQQYLDQIAESSQSLADIISDILDLSEIEAGHISIEQMPFDLHDLVGSVCGAYSEQRYARWTQRFAAKLDHPALIGHSIGGLMALKIAAANAIAQLAREQVPEEVAAAYGKNQQFGPDYIIPAPFDPRLMEVVSSAVAKAAMDSGVAQKPIADMNAYRASLRARQNPTTSVLTQVYAAARAKPKRVIFAEAEEDVVLRAAVQFKQDGYGVPVLVGRDARVTEKLIGLGANPDEYEIHNSAQSPLVEKMVDRLYNRLQRRGYLRRDIQRMVNRDRNIFGALMLVTYVPGFAMWLPNLLLK